MSASVSALAFAVTQGPTFRRQLEDPNGVLLPDITARVRTTAFVVLGNLDIVEDIVQTVLMKVWKHIDGFEGRNNAQLATWAIRIAFNECFMLLRSKQFRTTDQESVVITETGETLFGFDLLIDPSCVDIEEQICRQERIDTVRRAMRKVRRGLRQAVQAVDLKEMSREEAAASFGISAGALKSRLHRGRNALRQKLERLGSAI